MRSTRLWGLLALVCVTGCGFFEEGGPTMKPGEDCLSCHAGGGGERRGFTVAGTIFSSPTADSSAGLQGAAVLITDANGNTVSLESNSAGNFFTSQAIATPIQKVAVQHNGKTVEMPTSTQATGACNSCHTPGGAASGRLYAP